MTVDPDNSANLNATILEKIDQICLRFERNWQTHKSASIEDEVNDSSGQYRQILLAELLVLDIDYRMRNGELPKPSDYQSRFPNDHDTIQQVFYSEDPFHNFEDTSKCEKTIVARGNRFERDPPPQVGRYRIIKKLGSGGFGSVYLARDDELHRDVAIKIPHASRWAAPSDTDSFLKEARMLAKLRHPGIVPVYDVGFIDEDRSSCYVVSQLMDCGDLAEYVAQNEIDFVEAAQIVSHVAEALHYAHGRGLVHRDVKPSNILRDTDGRVYIADFGLALRDEDVGNGEGLTGTPASMSPEQARGAGHLVDGRTDVYGLGIVLYELLAGMRPFESKNVTHLLEQVLLREPKPLRQINDTIPSELERICLKALAKQPTERYSTAIDMANDLRAWEKSELDKGTGTFSAMQRAARGRAGKRQLSPWLKTAVGTGLLLLVAVIVALVVTPRRSAPQIHSIAILPFKPLDVDEENEYWGLGLADALITKLSNIHQIEVRPTGSIRQFSETEIDPLTAGRQLRVDAVLDGTIQRLGDRTRATVRLLQVSDGKSLWATTIDEFSADLFSVQDAISEKLARILALELSSEERQRFTRTHTESKEAREAYYRGRFHWNERSEKGVRKAVEYYQQAIKADPLYALAYAGLADTYAIWNLYVREKLEQAFPMARAAARKALEIDDQLYEAHATLAYVTFNYDWDWELAEIEFLRAIELNPNYATAHQWYAEYLFYMQRFDESIREIQRAAELDPLSPIINAELGSPYMWARDYENAEQEYLRSLQLYPKSFVALYGLGVCYEQQGKYEEAIKTYQETMGDPNEIDDGTVFVYAISGQEELARDHLRQRIAAAQPQSAYNIAQILSGLGDLEDAVDWLYKAYEERDERMVMLRVDPKFDALRDHPRFIELMRQLKHVD